MNEQQFYIYRAWRKLYTSATKAKVYALSGKIPKQTDKVDYVCRLLTKISSQMRYDRYLFQFTKKEKVNYGQHL